LIRAVVDTNVTVSGLLFGGVPLKVIHAALARKFTRITSPILIDEVERVMRYKKFGLTHHEVAILTRPLFSIAEIIVPVKTIDVITRCPADNRVLECETEGNCQFIVSGDRRDLVSLKRFQQVQILNPRQFLNQT
jgi:putative PIN family toxin of toxin-antitoxin system